MSKKRTTKAPRSSPKQKAFAFLIAYGLALTSVGYFSGSYRVPAARSEGCRVGVSALATNLFGSVPPKSTVNGFCEQALSKE